MGIIDQIVTSRDLSLIICIGQTVYRSEAIDQAQVEKKRARIEFELCKGKNNKKNNRIEIER